MLINTRNSIKVDLLGLSPAVLGCCSCRCLQCDENLKAYRRIPVKRSHNNKNIVTSLPLPSHRCQIRDTCRLLTSYHFNRIAGCITSNSSSLIGGLEQCEPTTSFDASWGGHVCQICQTILNLDEFTLMFNAFSVRQGLTTIAEILLKGEKKKKKGKCQPVLPLTSSW